MLQPSSIKNLKSDSPQIDGPVERLANQLICNPVANIRNITDSENYVRISRGDWTERRLPAYGLTRIRIYRFPIIGFSPSYLTLVLALTMRNLILIITALLLMTACSEKPPLIDFGPKASDSAYSAPVESPQQRIVLIEEFTGVTCPQCPAGHDALKSIITANPGRVAVIGIQPIGPAQSRPYDKDGVKTKNDNRTQAGTDIGSNIYGGVSALPLAGIDRIPDLGLISGLYSRADWPSLVEARKSVATKANIGITTVYNASNRQAAVTVRVAYTSTVNLRQKLTVAITEDNVVDVQELGTSQKYELNYVHKHVLRDILTTSTGSAILSSMATIPAGQVYERTFVYSLPELWNADNCNIVAYVSNNDQSSQEVLQSAEKKLR